MTYDSSLFSNYKKIYSAPMRNASYSIWNVNVKKIADLWVLIHCSFEKIYSAAMRKASDFILNVNGK